MYTGLWEGTAWHVEKVEQNVEQGRLWDWKPNLLTEGVGGDKEEKVAREQVRGGR